MSDTPSPLARDPLADLARRQAALLRLSAEISAAFDEQEICEHVVQGLRDEELGYDFVGLFLIDEPTEGLAPLVTIFQEASSRC